MVCAPRSVLPSVRARVPRDAPCARHPRLPVARGSFAHYLVKWVGRQLWEVSWEAAKELDTPWSRCAA